MRKINTLIKQFLHLLKHRSLPFLRENAKIIAQFILTFFFIAIGIWFFEHEQMEIRRVKEVLIDSRIELVLLGIGITVLYILLQGMMYVSSFSSLRCKISIFTAVLLYLKRNFVSIFLPVGGVSSLAFFASDIEKKGYTKTQIYFASSIYGFVGMLTVIMLAIPVFVYALIRGGVGSGEWYVLLAGILLIAAIYFIYKSVVKQGRVHNWLVRMIPSMEIILEDFRNHRIDRKQFWMTVFYSMLIEVTGITHLYIAMIALHFEPSLYAAVMGYLLAVLLLLVSPFMRGLGAIEVGLSYVLTRFGYPSVDAIAITFLFRFFEFWLPLVTSLFSFLVKINKLLMRVVPALLLFILGFINIVSVLTPVIRERYTILREFLPLDAIAASNYFVLASGLFLLLTAAFMLKGLRTAWWFALILSVVSFIGHITKGIDYEEAALAGMTILVLVVTRKEYHVRNNPRLRTVGIQTALYSIAAVLVYGIVGFYFLNRRFFEIDFSLWQSVKYTLLNYFLVGSSELVPHGFFARYFIYSINISGALTMGFLIYTLIRPYVFKDLVSEEDIERAGILRKKYGHSAADYFKTSPDKLLFMPEDLDAYISYRVSGIYAVVLEDPIAGNESSMRECVKRFDDFCFENGLKTIYFRIPEESLPLYKEFSKKSLFLGQEGVLDLEAFSLEGGARKSMRNAVNKVREGNYKTNILKPPLMDGDLQKIKSVSDEWLKESRRSEIIFSQGMFVWEEIKQQTVITIESPEQKVVAFLNIIPDYAKGEATYDLIRKTKDAPNGIMDFILIELFNYMKSQGIRYVNLGFAPMSGLDDPHTFPEKSMNFAYEKIRSFSHYKGLREYKEKFNPQWYNKYLVYNNDYDLLQVPMVLSKVIKP